MKVKGNDLILFFSVGGAWKTLAYGTTCEIDISADMEEVGSALTGKWKKYRKKRIGWSISSGHLLADADNEVDVFALVEAGEPIQINLATVATHVAPVVASEYVPDGRVQLQGAAILDRVTITARRGDYVTLSVNLTGSGELELIR